MIHVLLAEDQALLRQALAEILDREDDIAVVAQVGRGDEVLAAALRTRPDVALIDIDLGGESGLELARQLREQPGQGAVPHLILISTHDEADYADLIEASSAIGFLAKIDLSAATIRQMLAAIDGDKADES